MPRCVSLDLTYVADWLFSIALPSPKSEFALYHRQLRKIKKVQMSRATDSLTPDSGFTSTPITTTQAVNNVAERFAKASFLAVDTEFMREKTYYPQLCLIQISDGTEAVCIDPLAEGLDLSALWALMRNPAIVKVFHAASQDLEIFLNLMGDLPVPVYDTQIAAMVIGQGDQVGYDKLVKALLDHDIDKTSRFTDWSKRPLSERQIVYALDDVIYLAKIYPIIMAELEKMERAHWLTDEYKRLANPDTYRTTPQDAWKRIKIRNMKPAALLRLMHLAGWRETEAQTRDLPRNRIVRDETLIDIAGTNPGTRAEFSKIRNFPGGTEGKLIDPVLKILKAVADMPAEALPPREQNAHRKRPPAAMLELLRVLLKHVSDDCGIAPRLIASADDLETLALDDDAPIRALSGWRHEIFGGPALKLKHGEIAIAVQNRKIKLIDL